MNPYVRVPEWLGNLAKLLALYHPPSTLYKNTHPTSLTRHLTTSHPLTLYPDGDLAHPPRQPGVGCCHLRRQHRPPSRTPVAIPLDPPLPPLCFPGTNLVQNEEQPPTQPRPSPRPLPPSPPYHYGWRRLHHLYPLHHPLWHGGHHHPIRHLDRPTFRSL